MFDYVSNAAHWFSSPQVAPWAGAVAAVIAALTVDTKPWIKTPRKGGVRALRVLGIWLAIAGLFGIATGGPGGDKQGGADGTSPGATPSKAADAEPKAKQEPPAQAAPSKEEDSGEKFPASAADVVLIVKFLPAPGDEGQALDLSCDLVFRLPKGAARTAEIRAADMKEFEAAFARELRDYALPVDPGEAVASVRRRPFGGDGTLRKIEQLIKEAWPQIAVKFQE